MSAKQTIIPVFVPHLGCRADCVFCNQRRITGRVQPVTPAQVVRAIEQGAAMTPSGVQRQLAFYGGSFTAIPKSAQQALLEAAQPFLADGTLSGIRLSTRPDAIEKGHLSWLAEHGVQTIELGAQSMDDRVLALSGRGHTAQAVRRAAELVKEAGFQLILQMMTGLPGDADGQASVYTARELAALKPAGVRIYPTVIVRDTPLFDLWQTGQYPEHTLEQAVEVCARIVPIFETAGIPIIRLGLNPTEELSGGAAVAGAYHPALGELVRSRIMLHRARTLLSGTPAGADVVLEVPRGKLSQMIGQHRCNVQALMEEFHLHRLKVRENFEETGENFRIFVAKAGEIA